MSTTSRAPEPFPAGLLNYDDPHAPIIDLPAVLRTAARIRRRRRIAVTAGVSTAAALTVLVVAFLPVGPGKTGGRSAPSGPAGPGLGGGAAVVDLPGSGGWRAQGYFARDGSWCAGTLLPDARPGGPSATCQRWPGMYDGREPAFLLGVPMIASGPGDAVAMIGLVRGPVASVEMTIYGRRIDAQVFPSGRRDLPDVWIYIVLVPKDDRHSWNSSDIDTLIARNSAGQTIARYPPHR